MSRLGSSLNPTAPPVTVHADIAAALAQVALLPAAVQGAFRTVIYDLLSHHRLSVIGNAGKTFPARRQAQKAVASRTYRFTRGGVNSAEKVAELLGEGFAATLSDDALGPESMRALEEGPEITSSEFQALPVGAGLAMTRSSIAGRRQLFRDLVREKRLRLVPRPGRPALLVQDVQGRGRAHRSARANLIAVLVKRRHQRRLLRYYELFERVQAKDLPKFEAALALAMTEAGRVKLLERADRARAGSRAYYEAYRAFLNEHPGKTAEAKRVAKAAGLAARRLIPEARGGAS